jgi:hypothetical protein
MESPGSAISNAGTVAFRHVLGLTPDVARRGHVIGRAPIVSMPHWGGIIRDSQLSALVASIKTLKTG